ncbi:MAG: hypothetical protein HLUCCO18_08390 [Rhodobacteraceae bacterium HLUCCO18]|nr:MAG: hypothetical protein HLUCCO18_08390 [Rhodobacteraceae bacterium HLUCCO18]
MTQGELFAGRRGRPRVSISSRKLHIARQMLRAGATSYELAAFLEVSRRTVANLLSDEPAWARKRGRGCKKGMTDEQQDPA